MAKSPSQPLGDCCSQGGHRQSAGTLTEKMKKKPSWPSCAGLVAEVYNRWDEEDAPISGVDFVADTPDELIREAYKLFCVPAAKSKGAEQVLIEKRERYILKLDRYVSEKGDNIGSSQNEQLIALLRKAFAASPYHEVLFRLNEQKEWQLLPPFCRHPMFVGFVDNQRKVIIDYLNQKRARGLKLHDGRKSSRVTPDTFRRVSHDVMVVELLLFCCRRIKKETMASPLVKKIEGEENALQQKWLASMGEEKKRENKAHGENVRPSGGQKLTHLENWLFKHWTDPRLPLCWLNLQDTLKAANMSPQLPKLPSTVKNPEPGRTTAGAIRKVVERAGLDIPRNIFVRNVRVRRDNWPPFDFDIGYTPSKNLMRGLDRYVEDLSKAVPSGKVSGSRYPSASKAG